MGLHVVLRFAISDHHGDLRHILASPASCLLHKVLIQHEVKALARVGATPHVRESVDVLEDVFLVLMGIEQELDGSARSSQCRCSRTRRPRRRCLRWRLECRLRKKVVKSWGGHRMLRGKLLLLEQILVLRQRARQWWTVAA